MQSVLRMIEGESHLEMGQQCFLFRVITKRVFFFKIGLPWSVPFLTFSQNKRERAEKSVCRCERMATPRVEVITAPLSLCVLRWNTHYARVLMRTHTNTCEPHLCHTHIHMLYSHSVLKPNKIKTALCLFFIFFVYIGTCDMHL